MVWLPDHYSDHHFINGTPFEKQTFNYRTWTCPLFKWFRYLNIRYSDPAIHYIFPGIILQVDLSSNLEAVVDGGHERYEDVPHDRRGLRSILDRTIPNLDSKISARVTDGTPVQTLPR